ncbi:hypothetical protein RRG08_057241 [Elysia crispata]|uniref:Uncharacterized protein n=1 Tax=Elysia crispata TaxID=231223 RepID=A0AAE0ZTI5_9GAST|nr:hypothetical protein RRG08_057241 [Elysia crispata]
MRSRFMENQFGVRSRLMENHFDVGCILLENHFVSPVMCAPDRWRTSSCGLPSALQIFGEHVCVTCDVRSRLLENQFLWHLCYALQINEEPVCVTCDVRSTAMDNQCVSPVMCARDYWRTSLCHL